METIPLGKLIKLLLVKIGFEGPKFMMGKDQRKEKKLHNKDIDLEYPTWPWVDYKF